MFCENEYSPLRQLPRPRRRGSLGARHLGGNSVSEAQHRRVSKVCRDKVLTTHLHALVYRSAMDAAPQAIHVGASVATPSGAAPTTDTSLRRRRERSVSSDASDAYVEHLLRPDAPRVKPEQSKPAPSVEESDLGAATSDEHVQRQSEEGSAAEAEHGDHGAEGNPQEANAGPGEEKMCRICFDGPDEELGKLFSPCLCRGTVSLALFLLPVRFHSMLLTWQDRFSSQSRYVHTACLEQWRKASPNARAFWECQQCGYRYRLQRTALARVVTSPRACRAMVRSVERSRADFFGRYLQSPSPRSRLPSSSCLSTLLASSPTRSSRSPNIEQLPRSACSTVNSRVFPC